MRNSAITPRRLTVAAACIAASVMTFAAPAARAVGGVWWVAPTGTAANPASSSSSCANPSFVGNTHTALQAAIDAATSGEQIMVCPGVYSLGATLTVDKSLTITGESPRESVLDGGGTVRVIDITNGGVTVSLDNLGVRNGQVSGGSDPGAGVRVHEDATLNVSDSVFTNNRTAHHGGAISLIGSGGSTGSIHVSRSTFFNNHALDGGGIAVVGSTTNTSTVSNSTFVGNAAGRDGGALNGSFAALSADNSTFIDNTAVGDGSTMWVVTLNGSLIAYTPAVTITNSACNLANGTPVGNVSTESSCLPNGGATVSAASLQLGILAPWGGLTPTYSIGAGSSAIDATPSASCTAADQRGVSRSGSTCDAGSFEYSAVAGSLSSTGSFAVVSGRSISSSPTVTKTSLAEPVVLRVANELTGDLPAGVSFSTSTGQFSGTPSSTYTAPWVVVTAVDNNGVTVSTQIPIDNCVLNQSNGSSLISSAADLELFRLGVCGLGASYRQTADIAWSATWDGPASLSTAFTGSYDGDGHSITGLQISGGENAFLRRTDGATITDLAIDVAVTGGWATSGLVKYATATTIDGVDVSGTVTITAIEGCHGGIAGEIDGSSVIRNSSFVGDIIAGPSSWIGGLVGCAYDNTVVERSYFEGDLTGNDDVGGLVGFLENSDITDSYAIGSLTATVDGLGGLAGWQSGDSSDADTVAITNSYSSMSVTGVAHMGTLLGEGASTSIASSFWEGGLNGIGSLPVIGVITDAGTAPALTATSTSDMKSYAFFNTAGWAIHNGWVAAGSSQDVWGICDGTSRPFLLWQHATDACSVSTPPTPTTTPATTTPATTTPATIPGTTEPVSETPVTTQPSTTTTQPSTGPSVSAGDNVVYVGGQPVNSNISWSGGDTIAGTIGSVQFSLDTNSPSGAAGTLAAGASMALTLNGLQPGSSATATLFSTPTSLGSFTVGSSGTLSADIAVPRSVESGSHRLRLEMTAANGDAITVWLGVNVDQVPSYLPATGSSTLPHAHVAVWILMFGLAAVVVSRRRSVGRQ